MLTNFKFLTQDESAAAAVEYGLLLAFIAIVVAVGLNRVSSSLYAIYDQARDALVRH